MLIKYVCSEVCMLSMYVVSLVSLVNLICMYVCSSFGWFDKFVYVLNYEDVVKCFERRIICWLY